MDLRKQPTSTPSNPPSSLADSTLAILHLPPEGALLKRGPGWRLILAVILLLGITTVGAMAATGQLRQVLFSDTFEDY